MTPPDIRNKQSAEYQGRTGHWCVMNHPGESDRNFQDLVEYYLVKNHWDLLIPTGSTVIDIGGHSGDTAVPMLLAGAAVVLSMEPNPVIKPYLDHVAELNQDLGRIITTDLAVTTHAQALTIFDHSNQLCNGGMIDPTWTPELTQQVMNMAQQSVACSGDTLAAICAQYLTPEEINRISLIKTDTEGHDASILESSAEFIDAIRPVIITEWFWLYGAAETNRLFDIINSMDYIAFDPMTLTVSNRNQKTDDLLLIHASRLDLYPFLRS